MPEVTDIQEEVEDTESTEELKLLKSLTSGETAVEQSDSDAYDTDLDIEDDSPKTYKSMTGKDIYMRSCEQLGVIPASYFVEHMNDAELNMSHHGLGPKGAKAIAAPLVVNTSIVDLNIEDNWITCEGAKDISEMLLENCYIMNLNLSHNKLESKGAQYICDMLVDNSSLRSVNVSGNGFRDRDAMYFADAFRCNFKLKEFDLSENEFREIGGEWMGQAIAANESIEVLNLSWNHLRLKGALAVCAGLKVNITIRNLDLSWNGFANEGAAAMAEALKTNNTLTWLDLSHNRITGDGAVLLAKGLLVNDTLRTLRIGNNAIDAEGALALLKAIAENPKSAMEELDLLGVRVNEEFRALAKELAEKSTGTGSRTSFKYQVNRTQKMGTNFDPNGENDDPMDILQDFLQNKRLRLVDLFRNFDKDMSWKISPAEFRKGIENSGIKMGKRQLKSLMDNLDVDIDGQVNYSEMLTGKKEALLRKRQLKKQQEREEKLKQLEKDRFNDAWSKAMQRATSPIPSPRASPLATPRSSRPSSARSYRDREIDTGSPIVPSGNTLTVRPVTPRIQNAFPGDDRSRRRSTIKSEIVPVPLSVSQDKVIPTDRLQKKRMSLPATTPLKYSLTPTARVKK